jgi:hypothetical protein
MAGAALIISTSAVFADQISPLDGDTAVNPTNISYTLSPNSNQRNCANRGEAVPGELTLAWNGNSHFDTAQNLTLSATTPAGVSVSFTGGSSYALGTWTDDSHTDRVINFSTTVLASATSGTVTIRISGSGFDNKGALADGYSIDSAFNVSIDCSATPVNQAPGVLAAFTAASVNCQTQAQLDVSFTDSDSTAWTAAVDWNYVSPTFNGTSVGAVTSPFSLTHTYAAPGTYIAGVVVTDNQGAASDVAIDSIDVLQAYSNSFLQPIDGLQATGKKNTFKNGRVLPVKVVITDVCTGDPVTGSSGEAVTAALTKEAINTGGADAIETFADAGASSGNTDLFRWSLDGFWIYNLDSKALGMTSGSTYELKVVVDGVAASQTAALQPTK